MTTRQQRNNKALSPHFFQLQEQSFEQLLVWAKRFARLVPYRDQNDQAAGHWGGMFEQSELVVSAAVLSINLDQYKLQFKQAKQLGEASTQQYLLHLYHQLNQWYVHLPSSPDIAYQLKFTLLNLFQTHLAAPLKQLLENIAPGDRPDISQFDPLWGLDQLALVQRLLPKPVDHSQFCFSKIHLVITRLQNTCQSILTASLKQGEHAPQLALYISFLKLFERAQQKINTFTHRHLLFYYQDVLQQDYKKVPDDQVYLKLSQSTTSSIPVEINKGDVFSPGSNAQFQRIDYQATYPMVVTDAEVTHAFNLTLHRDPQASPEREMGFVCGINTQKIMMTADAKEPDFPKTQRFRMFGTPVEKNASQENSPTQTMGLVISNPILAMAEGQRELTLHFELQEIRQGMIEQQLYLFSEFKDHQGQEPDIRAVLTQFFEHLLVIHRHLLDHVDNKISASQLVAKLQPEQIQQLTAHSPAQQLHDIYRLFFLTLLKQTAQSKDNDQQAVFFGIFGQLICRYILSPNDWLTKSDRADIYDNAKMLADKQIIDSVALETIEGLLSHSKTTAFYQLFNGVFHVEITTTDGWKSIRNSQIHPINETEDDNTTSQRMGFILSLKMDPGFSATVPATPEQHGQQWSLPHPALRLTLKKQTNCYPYSIFQGFEWSSVSIHCQVTGMTRFQLYNNDGQTDPSQPFLPFGAQPSDESYLVIANEELARKNIKSLTFQMDWADLPRGSDGFRQHYEGYPHLVKNHSFQVSTDVLNNGQWTTLGPLSQPLFQPAVGVLEKSSSLRINAMQQAFTPVTQGWPTTPFSPQSGIRNGLFKIKLNGPQNAFGHRDYGPLFSQVLTANAKTKKPKPLPNLPYTPILNRFSVDYEADSHIDLTRLDSDHQGKIIHLHPFGESQIYPPIEETRRRLPRLMPDYQLDSQLFIGLSASQLSGYLNVFFLFDGSSKLLTPYPSTSYHWHYLVNNEWIALSPQNIIHDTTQGFLTTGIVTLDIPDNINSTHQIMPNGVYWLRVSTNHGVNRYPNCLHVATHVLQVNGRCDPTLSASFSEWKNYPKQPNLGKIAQLTPMKQTQEQETQEQWITRISETLRHKGQAITPWDYERLVLEKFTDIGAAYCFSSRQFDRQEPSPGRVLLIVTPRKTECQHSPCQPKMVDATALLSIRNMLQSVGRQGLQIEVRNPGYEKIQVRCRVSFHAGVHHGLALRQLNYAIHCALCPWQENSMNQGLGWQLSLNKLASFINQQPNVANVSGISVLKISQQQTRYALQDSASTQQPIKAQYPWYLLIPREHHYIQIENDSITMLPEPTGIGELIIGEEFIINPDNAAITNITAPALDDGTT
ncbi:hypothetical protein MSP8886_02294 [Marinomonas spartinae]|uniref:Baseplate protein J-like domain-containing protein n=1 Tax=Marinomonas spartinae TaxID=1792290 RepID=A0A1A8THV5_9GAMM|nr:hypothetical protein [Marinomonas spartinae]SBS31961.1 hypothetical protein MSP8886_02294 [Marinomonas spartinae]